jgi:hypothetical protein
MITLLESLIDSADGTYVNTQDLRKLEHAMSSWAERKEAYLSVQLNEKTIIDLAIEMMEKDRQSSGEEAIDEVRMERCRRDITLALRYYALAMLLQDEEMLKERFLYWQKNVLQAMGLHHYQGVSFVYKSLCEELERDRADLFKPYFKLGQDVIMSDLN